MRKRKGARERWRRNVRGRGAHVGGLVVSCGVRRTASSGGLAAHGGRAAMYAGGASTASFVEDAGAAPGSTRRCCVGRGGGEVGVSGGHGRAVALSLRAPVPPTPFAQRARPLRTYTASVFPVGREAPRGLPSLLRCMQRVHLGASPRTRSAARLPPSSRAVDASPDARRAHAVTHLSACASTAHPRRTAAPGPREPAARLLAPPVGGCSLVRLPLSRACSAGIVPCAAGGSAESPRCRRAPSPRVSLTVAGTGHRRQACAKRAVLEDRYLPACAGSSFCMRDPGEAMRLCPHPTRMRI